MFATFWTWMDEQVDAGIVIAPEEVLVELDAKGQSPLVKWVRKRKDDIFQAHETDVQHLFKQISASFPELTRKGKPQARSDGDAWVIAMAKIRGAVCVAEDRKRRAGTSFPEVCAHYGVPLIFLRDFIDRETK